MIELVKFVLSWGENHNAGIEDIGPTDVGSRSERMGDVKQMGDWTDWKYVRIQEDDLGELGEAKNMEFSKDRGKVRAT